MSLLTKIDNPQAFWEMIPRDIQGNIEFRKELHTILEKDLKAQELYRKMCLEKIEILFDTAFFTYNPKNKPGYRNMPFILRPQQIKVVKKICEYINEGKDLLIDKSRDEGATEMVSKCFAGIAMLVPQTSFLCGSRKEEYVDGSTNIDLKSGRVTGSPKSIFHKILYAYATCPKWMRVKVKKTHMHIELDNGSVIDGEATNENFAAGDRRTAILLDEFGRVEHKLAQSIRETVSDTSDCVIYNSTHFYGRGHPYGKLCFSKKLDKIILDWSDNPEKSYGMYRSPDFNKIEILDMDYYQKNYPELNIQKEFKYSDFEIDLLPIADRIDIKFVADGSKKYRSPWYDKEEARRDPRDMAQNVDRNPSGASDLFFDSETLRRIEREWIKKPTYVGELKYDLNPKIIRLYNFRFKVGAKPGNFKWWGPLINNRPIQHHNYIVSADISMGSGASNSVAKVYDVNTNELVGKFQSPDVPPEEFCDQTIAICHWVGGMSRQPYLIWEANGPGNAFNKRREKLGYYFIYIDTITRALSPRRTKKPGWSSSQINKYDALIALRIAVNNGFRNSPIGPTLIIHDDETLKEYEDFIFLDNGNVGLSACVTETGSARAAHGDNVIPDAMAVEAMRTQKKAAAVEMTRFCEGSMMHRRVMAQEEQNKKGENSPWLN